MVRLYVFWGGRISVGTCQVHRILYAYEGDSQMGLLLGTSVFYTSSVVLQC